MSQPHRSRVLRGVYLLFGLFFLGVGVVGIVLPLIPTTFPVILAGFFFARSSERFDRWLMNHRLFGPLIGDWRAGVGFTVKAKSVALTAITLTFTISVVWVVKHVGVRVGLVALAVAIGGYILSLPTKPVTET